MQLHLRQNGDFGEGTCAGVRVGVGSIHAFFVSFSLGPLSQPFLDVLDAKAKAAGKDGVNMSATHNRFFPKSLADNVESLVVDAVAKKVA